MQAFAALLDGLLFAPGRNAKLRLIGDYLARTPDPARGYAIAALTGDLRFKVAKPALLRGLIETRLDPVLFAWSYDFVGDLAETVALAWPPAPSSPGSTPDLRPDLRPDLPPDLPSVIAALARGGRIDLPGLLAGWLDRLDATGRWALLKLITGNPRVGVSARLAKLALAEWGGVEAAAIEEIWHGLAPPYQGLFDWLGGAGGPRPDAGDAPLFRSPMLAHPLTTEDLDGLDPAAFRAEWKWDGIRVQLVRRQGQARLYSRTGDDIGGAFPEILAALDRDVVLDGELLIGEPYPGNGDGAAPGGRVEPFSALQRRLNRKTVTPRLQAELPAFVRLYDLLFDAAEDLRPLSHDRRRLRLEAWLAQAPVPRFDLSPRLGFADWTELAAIRDGMAETVGRAAIEGVMLKRADSPYLAGRPKGLWFKWKRGPLTADCVLMYAQRGHGKRSSFYSDFTFGCWQAPEGDAPPALVPVGKAYFGFTDAELLELDRWVRDHTVNRFGPVREVTPGLVLEIAFDSLQRSTRHRSGVAMRFPRIHRIRWDKPVEEAEQLSDLLRYLD